MIRLRRVYEGPPGDRSHAVMVDRLWPRGVPKSRFAHVAWLKDVAPTPELRRWFNHEPEKWAEFRRRYRQELGENREALEPLLEAARAGDLTLQFAARDPAHNHALVLKEYLEELLHQRGGAGR